MTDRNVRAANAPGTGLQDAGFNAGPSLDHDGVVDPQRFRMEVANELGEARLAGERLPVTSPPALPI